MKRKPTTIIFRRASGKSPIFQPIEIASRFCLRADFWEINLQGGHPTREPDKAFHNPAPAAAAIPSWPANPGLYSSHAVEVSWPAPLATNPFLLAVFSLVGRSNSLGCPSRAVTVTRARANTVFTHTQATQRFNKIALVFSKEGFRNVSGMNPKANDARSSLLKAQAEWQSKPVRQIVCFQIARDWRKRNFHSTTEESLSKKSSSIRGILSLDGQSSFGSTLNALARQSSSKSETHRNCVSIFARVCRLKSHPHRRQRAASIGCVSFCWSRNRRICGPTRFRGFFFMFPFQNWNSRGNAIAKGSEFRTAIFLASFGAFWEGRHGSRVFNSKKNSFNKSSQYLPDCHRRAIRAS